MLEAPNLLAAEAAASKLLRWYGISSVGQIDVDAIAWGCGVRVRYGPLDGLEAWLLRTGQNGVIRVNDDTLEEGRKRFSVAHELGHWELHAKRSQEWLCTNAEIHAYRGSPPELEANAFAASLLMPERLFKPKLRSGVTMQTVVVLAREFHTSLTATAVRCVHLADEDLFAVFSKSGEVRRWERSPHGSGLWFRKRQALHEDSLALWSEQQPSQAADMREVPVYAWFEQSEETVDRHLWEQSVYLRNYDTVLTLLCLV